MHRALSLIALSPSHHWREQLKAFLPEAGTPYLARDRSCSLEGHQVVVMSYDMMTTLNESLTGFGVVTMVGALTAPS